MNKYFMDFHVHIGRSNSGAPVKITASRDLTFANIAQECKHRKGIDIVGIVDCASPEVIDDISQLINNGEMKPLKDGGLIYRVNPYFSVKLRYHQFLPGLDSFFYLFNLS